MTNPHQGGSYRREADGSLTRTEEAAPAPIDAPAIEEPKPAKTPKAKS